MEHRYRILLVDNNPTLLRSIAEELKQYGFDVVTATNGVEALSQYHANQGNFNAILTDNRMPQMNGAEFLKRIRLLGYPGRVLVMSGRLTARNLRIYRCHAVDGFLQKPFETKIVAALLKRPA